MTNINNEIDFDDILTKYRSDPYDYVDVFSTRTGVVKFQVQEGDEVEAPGGEWQHIPGTSLYEITRERNPRLITAGINGVVSFVRSEINGRFVEAGEKLLTIRHPLKKKEVIENILKDVLFLFPAPETAKYFFSMDIQARLDKKGLKSVAVSRGDEVLTMSLMKRDTPVNYTGVDGVIYAVYFKPGVSVEQGQPLIGVCPPEKVELIQKVIAKVKADWDK